MNRVPRSSSLIFPSGKKQPKPPGSPRGKRKAPFSQPQQPQVSNEPKHEIKIEKVQRTQSTQEVLTPADINTSYRPAQPAVRIDRSIKRSVSFTKNGVELTLSNTPTPSTSVPD